jgi:pilus assembly protein CpaF
MRKDDYNKLSSYVRNNLDLTSEVDEKELRELIISGMENITKESYLSLADKEELSLRVYNSILKLDLLQEFIDDPDISEVMINGYDNIYYEKKGVIHRSDKTFESKEKLEDVVQRIVAGCNKSVNETYPIADARLADGSRVNIVLYPIALNGPIVTIRRFGKHVLTMEDMVDMEIVSKDVADFLNRLIVAGYNMVISGGTSSGKTTLLNALSNYIPRDERIITIEDNAELRIIGVDNLVTLETRRQLYDESRDITIRDLIKTALRMRPDRIIVGECRGAEAFDMLQAMNTGHDGSLTTAHANSAKDMLLRLEAMVLMAVDLPIDAIRRQIASAVDIVVHLERLPDRSRRITQISEIAGLEKGEIIMNELFNLESENGRYEIKRNGNLIHKEKLQRRGVFDTGLQKV